MKYFTDQNLTDEILNDELDLGTVDGGETKQYTIWALNDYRTFIKNLKFSIVKSEPIKDEKSGELIYIVHPEVKITKAPETMLAEDRKKIVFTWSPDVTLEEGIKVTLKMSGKKVWG